MIASRTARVLLPALAALLLPHAVRAGLLDEERKATRAALAVKVERIELPNGLVVLLAPDPTVSSVAVWITFRAGALYEPPGRSGLAHLVEHVMATGPTPGTDYAGILERRRARWFNASTGFDAMSFEAIVPAEELPAALWVAGDRLATLPHLVDAATVERSRRVVVQERALRDVDAPYGLVREQLLARLYPAPHPLHGGVIGAPAELARATAADVRAFVSERLVPANAVLTVVGRFDSAVARRLAEEALGGLPAGHPSRPPATRPPAEELVAREPEPLGRQPRVTLAWRLPGIPHQDATALRLGAQLLTQLTDGAWGMAVGADLAEYDGEAVFTVDVTTPYDEPMSAVHADAEGFLRQLTRREMPLEHLVAANLALDRAALFDLDTLPGRARLLSRLEQQLGSRWDVAEHCGAHWQLEGDVVRDTARAYLQGPRLVLHARPLRPRPARPERE